MRIRFNMHRGDRILSRAIMLLSRGNFSHVSIEASDTVYEAREGLGVIKTPASQWSKRTVVKYYEFDVPCETHREIVAWLDEQVGKKYDWTGVFSHIFPVFLKPRIGYWYCSELSFVVLNKICGVEDDTIQGQKVSPQLFNDITLMSSQIYGII